VEEYKNGGKDQEKEVKNTVTGWNNWTGKEFMQQRA
jgi:hypothetical protein